MALIIDFGILSVGILSVILSMLYTIHPSINRVGMGTDFKPLSSIELRDRLDGILVINFLFVSIYYVPV